MFLRENSSQDSLYDRSNQHDLPFDQQNAIGGTWRVQDKKLRQNADFEIHFLSVFNASVSSPFKRIKIFKFQKHMLAIDIYSGFSHWTWWIFPSFFVCFLHRFFCLCRCSLQQICSVQRSVWTWSYGRIRLGPGDPERRPGSRCDAMQMGQQSTHRRLIDTLRWTYKKLWKITMLFMGKSTISMAIFNSYVSLPIWIFVDVYRLNVWLNMKIIDLNPIYRLIFIDTPI